MPLEYSLKPPKNLRLTPQNHFIDPFCSVYGDHRSRNMFNFNSRTWSGARSGRLVLSMNSWPVPNREQPIGGGAKATVEPARLTAFLQINRRTLKCRKLLKFFKSHHSLVNTQHPYPPVYPIPSHPCINRQTQKILISTNHCNLTFSTSIPV